MAGLPGWIHDNHLLGDTHGLERIVQMQTALLL